ncbi:MAG: hypothetical protein QM831_22550 [Kofleriaceae bacterium]
MQDRAERVDIGARIDQLATRLLRWHVRSRTDHGTRVCECSCRGLIAIRAGGEIILGIRLREILRESPIDYYGVAVRTDENVVWRQVAMNHVAGVCKRDGFGGRDYGR